MTLTEFRALAERAISGRWHVNPHDELEVRTETRDARGEYYQTVCETYNADTATWIAAASPTAILALIDEIERLKETDR